MLYEEVRKSPRLAVSDWKTRFLEGLVPDDDNLMEARIYQGTGVPIENHPLVKHCNFSRCGNCESDNVLVIYAQWSVSLASGDAYWDYEIICQDCNMYTSRSFSEND